MPDYCTPLISTSQLSSGIQVNDDIASDDVVVDQNKKKEAGHS